MGIHKESSINLWVKLIFFANTHALSLYRILGDSNASFGFNKEIDYV